MTGIRVLVILILVIAFFLIAFFALQGVLRGILQ